MTLATAGRRAPQPTGRGEPNKNRHASTQSLSNVQGTAPHTHTHTSNAQGAKDAEQENAAPCWIHYPSSCLASREDEHVRHPCELHLVGLRCAQRSVGPKSASVCGHFSQRRAEGAVFASPTYVAWLLLARSPSSENLRLQPVNSANTVMMLGSPQASESAALRDAPSQGSHAAHLGGVQAMRRARNELRGRGRTHAPHEDASPLDGESKPREGSSRATAQ